MLKKKDYLTYFFIALGQLKATQLYLRYFLKSLSNFNAFQLTLFLPKFRTEHANIASRPAGYVTLLMVPKNSGSGSSCEFGSVI